MTTNPIVDDYLHRAVIRRGVLATFYSKNSWIDVVQDALHTVDLVTLAAMHAAQMNVSPEITADNRLPNDSKRHINGIEHLLQKARQLKDVASSGGTVIPSAYYTQEDADLAIKMADNMLKLFGTHMRPDVVPAITTPSSSRPTSGRRMG